MRTNGFGIARVMKYVVLVLVIAFVAMLLIYASGSSRPFKEVEDAVSGSLDKSNLTLQDGTAFKREFGLNEADYAGVMYYASEFSISAEEVKLLEDAKQSVRGRYIFFAAAPKAEEYLEAFSNSL